MGDVKPAGGTFFKYISPEWRYVYERYKRKASEERDEKKAAMRAAEAARVRTHNMSQPGNALPGADPGTGYSALQPRGRGGAGAMR